MDWPTFIRAEEWLAIVLGMVGVFLGLQFSFSNYKDLQAYKIQGWNGYATYSALIGIINGLSKSVLHAMLMVLPALVILTATPTSQKDLLTAVVFFAALAAGQSSAIAGQLANIQLRRLLFDKLRME